jgi:exopolysaccharide biosynthesis polyprenyl glycosylphosphotransferase
MSQTIHPNKVPHTPPVDTNTGKYAMIGGATGPITKVISRRRSNRHQWRIFERVFMITLDAFLLVLSVYLAHSLRYNVLHETDAISQVASAITGEKINQFQELRFLHSIPLVISFVTVLILLFAIRGLYKLRLTGSWFRQMWTITTATTIGVALLMAYYYFFQYSNPLALNSRSLVLFIWLFTILVLGTGRLLVSAMMGMLYRMGHGETRLLVVGSGRLGKLTMQHIAANPALGYSIVGFLHDLDEPLGDFGRFKMLGTIDDIGLVIRSMQVDEVIIALPSHMNQQALRSVKLCERLGATFKLIPDLYEVNLSRIDMETIEGIPLLGIKQASLNTIQRFITRLIDIAISGTILLLGSPLWLFLAAAVRLSSPGEVIFKQPRVGLNGVQFFCYKFRSMYKDADQRLALLLHKNEAQGPLFKMKDDPRITPVGKFLRRTSLDEIPQLLNVLKGDMSLVGPRPAVPREVEQYEDWQRGRLAIRPGLTGLWQVRGRSDLSFDEGVLMDLYYIENWSLNLYIQILLRTIPAVLFSRGAY